jgi:TolA-binding protein
VENIELFDGYLKNSLSAEECKSFEARLSYDADFNQEFETYKQLEKGIKTHFRNQLKEKLENTDQVIDDKKKQAKVRSLTIITASIAACFAAVFYFIPSDSKHENITQIVSNYWPYEEGLPVKMSSKGKYDDAMNAFKQEEWEKAESLLRKIESDTATYFLGIITYETNSFNTAEKYFNQIDESSSYFEDAQFRLALSYLRTNKINLATKTFHALIERNSPFTEKAKSILSQVK